MEPDKVEICCLKGIGDQDMQLQIIALDKSKQIVIGRAADANVRIDSDMISRKHAVLTKQDGSWLIRDNKSLNGVYINDKQLEGDSSHVLQEGDRVQLGVSKQPGQAPPYVWVFKTKLKVKKIKKPVEGGGGYVDQAVSCSQASAKDEGEQSGNTAVVPKSSGRAERKRSRSPEQHPSTSGVLAKRGRFKESPFRQERLEHERQLSELQQKQEARLRAMQEEQCRVEAELQAMQAQKQQLQLQWRRELEEKQAEMNRQLQEQQELLRKQEEELKQRLQESYKKELQEKENELIERLQREKDELLEEKSTVERSLQQEMERKLDEKDRDLESKLRKQKESLERIIEQKETEQRFLVSELDEFKEETEKQKESALSCREEILSRFAELLETELQCTICNQLFIQATSLNCSHSFCSLCLERWMAVKQECPVCRAPITSHLHSRVLDSYIDRMVAHLSEEMRARRAETVQERQAEMRRLEEEKAAKMAATAAAMRPTRRRRGGRGGGAARRGGRRGGGQRRRGGADDSVVFVGRGTVTNTLLRATVLSSDSDSDSNSNNNNEERVAVRSSSSTESDSEFWVQTPSSDSESSLEGATGAAFYGGYGCCYSCGRRGHWANDCPFDH